MHRRSTCRQARLEILAHLVPLGILVRLESLVRRGSLAFLVLLARQVRQDSLETLGRRVTQVHLENPAQTALQALLARLALPARRERCPAPGSRNPSSLSQAAPWMDEWRWGLV